MDPIEEIRERLARSKHHSVEQCWQSDVGLLLQRLDRAEGMLALLRSRFNAQGFLKKGAERADDQAGS